MPSVLRLTSSSLRVRATTSSFIACGTAVIQIFCPLRRQPLPSARAKLRSASEFVPASGSVNAMAKVAAPAARAGSSSACISGVPKRLMVAPPNTGLHMKSWLSVEPPPPAQRA